MSSIALLHNKSAPEAERKAIVNAMNNIAVHRGRDYSNEFHDDEVSIGYNGLLFSEKEDDSRQPLIEEDFVVLFDGNIYNSREVRENLEQRAYRFKTNSEAEVLLKAYLEWGAEGLNQLNGSWALIIYDKTRKNVFAARDQLGIKPIYFMVESDFLAIASEVKQLLAFTENSIENETAFAFLNNGFTDYSRNTFMEGISMLMPSEFMNYNLHSGEIKTGYYHHFKKPLETVNEEGLLNLIDSSISLRKRDKHSTALSLSGGLDSNIIAYHLSKAEKRRIHAFTSVFTWWEEDEREAAMESAAFFELKYFTEEAQWNNLKADLGKISYIHDQPIAGFASYASFKLFELIAKYRIKVELNGQGLDELFAGYESYYMRYLLHLLKRKPITAFSEFAHGAGSGQYNFKALLKQSRQAVSASKRPWLLKEFSIKNSFPEHDTMPFLGERGFKAIHSHALSSMLHSVDRNSMFYSIESRLPFLDFRIVEQALYLEDSVKIKKGIRKRILRKLYKDKLPAHITENLKKQGYATPQDLLMEKDKAEIIEEIRDLQQYLPDWVDNKQLLNSEEIKRDLKLLWRVWAWVRWREYNREIYK